MPGKTRMIDAPEGTIGIDTYQELSRVVQAFAAGRLNLLILAGPPGVQKSHALRSALPPRACHLEGSATPFGMYCELYRCRHQLVVIDDVDGLLNDRGAIRLLKCLCQTDRHKRLAWHSDAATLRHEAIPRSFRTTSRVALITNELPSRLGRAAALLDRGHQILFQPTAEEVHRRTAEWFWDQEVFDFVGQHRPRWAPASMRDYRLGWELKQAALDWQSWLLQKWGLHGPRLLVAQLKADSRFQREADRVRSFIDQGGGCRATYYNLARKLSPPRPLPPLQLTSPPPPDRCTDEQLLQLLRRRFRSLGGD